MQEMMVTRWTFAKIFSPGTNGGVELVVEVETLVMVYKRPEDRVAGSPYTSVILEEDNGSMEAV